VSDGVELCDLGSVGAVGFASGFLMHFSWPAHAR